MKKIQKMTIWMTDKKMHIAVCLILAGIFFILYNYFHDNQTQKDYNKKAIVASLEKYELIKKTELSKLHDQMLEIIRNRRDCFFSRFSYSERNDKCNRDYTNSIVQLARDNIKSAPMPGLFIRCIKECPIAGSLCNGEEDSNELDCIEMEARCIEYCFDEYWRGGNSPNGNIYTYKKNKN